MGAFSVTFSSDHPSRAGVQRTPELLRVFGLPRRTLDLDAGTVDGKPLLDLSVLYVKRPGHCADYPRCPICSRGVAKLWPTQAAALIEAERADGLFGMMGVGAGKSLVTLLLPDVLQSQRTALLVPASVRRQLVERDIYSYGRHFRLPLDRISVIAYSELSTVQGAEALEKVKPDLVVADECHLLARFTSARTKRFIRYMRENPSTRFCGLSGTVTKRSLRDFAHICELALRAGSPLPNRWNDLKEWADAIDPIRNPLPVGALRILAPDSQAPQFSEQERADVRAGFRRRLVETPGVVATSESWEGASLEITARMPPLPPDVAQVLTTLRDTWQIEDEEIEDAMHLVAICRNVSCGFYYRWAWPGGVKDKEWLKARADWHKTVREILKISRAGLDSPLLVARAAERGQLSPAVSTTWQAWKKVSDRPPPPVEAVWIDQFLIHDAQRWAAEDVEVPGIIWYAHAAVANALSEHFPVYGAGTDAGTADPAKQPVIACSITAQGIGKNLQRYARSLVMEPPSSGTAFEQLLGRTHRPGQLADVVDVSVLQHTDALRTALEGAVSDAIYVQETQGQRQKLLAARRIGW